jgi:hypothetical protein
MSLLADATPLVPPHFSLYRFGSLPHGLDSHEELFFPKVGFTDDTEAVGVTGSASVGLAGFHEGVARKYS